jgi:tetratricopeptide (TPR) repeat protein
MSFPASFDALEKWRDDLRQTLAGKDLLLALEDRIGRESDPVRVRILSFFLADEHVLQGDSAAAEAVRLRDPVMEIHRWHQAWRRTHETSDIIPVLNDRIARETHPLKVSELLYFLAEEYRDRGDYVSSEAAYLEKFNRNPTEPMPLIILAGQKLNDEDLPDEAMRIINRAVDVARRSGTFRRHALGVKARIGLRRSDYRIVEDALREIMDLTFTRGNVDMRAERDFLDELPPGALDPEVARRYDEYCRGRATRTPDG